jgi:hypothetical protein
MDAGGLALMQLASWPDLTTGPAACGTGTALTFQGRQVVHFHDHDEADVYLTAPVTARLAPALGASTAVRLAWGQEWITVLLDVETDAELLLSLTSVALKAHQQPRPATAPAPCAPCNRAVPRPPDPPQGGPAAPRRRTMNQHRYHLDTAGHSVTVTVSARRPHTAVLLVDGKEEDLRALAGQGPVDLHGELADDPPRPFTVTVTPAPGHFFHPPTCTLAVDGTQRPLPLTP